VRSAEPPAGSARHLKRSERQLVGVENHDGTHATFDQLDELVVTLAASVGR
jgi:hypothetical protein